ncbi:NPFFR2 [Mytilus coruscus]|uniref:NPFFR2 n=1 Tax=Mytilus coruscus TaxID=42192 RepID=A0A6J8E2Y2_MYTCO|nr:NPFFR2 [Mytilus coruscus]
MINKTCSNCDNESVPVAKMCYPWVADEFNGRNYTLDDVNNVVMLRNYAGITFLGIVIVLGLIGNGHVLRTSRRYSTSTPAAFKQSQAKQEQQRVWIYASVTIGYVVGALPYHILAILLFAGVIVDCDMSLPESELFYLFIWSYFFSPVINPIIYGFQDDGFRFSVQAIYRRSTKTFKRRLYDRKNSNGHISNGNVDSDKSRQFSQSGSQILTEITTEDDFNADIKPRSELKDIMLNMAAFTVDTSAIIFHEDENKNAVHM